MMKHDVLLTVNAAPRYTNMAKVIHWTSAIVIVATFTIGWSLDDLEGAQLGDALSAHVFFGLLVFSLVVLRTAWRFSQPVQVSDDPTSAVQGRLTGGVHAALYALMFLVPLTGLLAASAHETRVSFLGLDVRSALSFLGSGGFEMKMALHWTMQTLLMLLITGHIFAALYHQFWLKDGLILRMLPNRRTDEKPGT